MDNKPVSDEQKRRVSEMQNLLATHNEQIIPFYFDMQLRGNMVPGSTDITCYVCSEFQYKGELMTWISAYQDSHMQDMFSCFYCERCEFHFYYPCSDDGQRPLLFQVRRRPATNHIDRDSTASSM